MGHSTTNGVMPDDGTGNNSTNGLLPATVETNAGLLYTLMKGALPASDDGTLGALDTLVANADDPSSQSARFLNDLTQCSLPVGKTWIYVLPTGKPSTFPWQGTNLMNLGGEDWTTTPLLDVKLQKGVLSCLAARMNFYGAQVNIYLAGNQVVPNPDVSPPPYFEALWYASLAGQPPNPVTIAIDVWPSAELTKACIDLASLKSAIQRRVCSSASTCGANVHDRVTTSVQKGNDITAQCSRDTMTSHWTCNGHDVIETRLGPADWQTIYAATNCTNPTQI